MEGLRSDEVRPEVLQATEGIRNEVTDWVATRPHANRRGVRRKLFARAENCCGTEISRPRCILGRCPGGAPQRRRSGCSNRKWSRRTVFAMFESDIANTRIVQRLLEAPRCLEATPEVRAAMQEAMDPWPSSIEINTGEIRRDKATARALNALEGERLGRKLTARRLLFLVTFGPTGELESGLKMTLRAARATAGGYLAPWSVEGEPCLGVSE